MAKRGNSEGSIYKRRDGRWAGVIDLGWEGGKRKRKSYYGETRQDVARQLTAALRAHHQGLPVAPERQTVGQFLGDWLNGTAKPKLRPRTFQSYAEIVRLHRAPELGHLPLAKLSPQAVQAVMNRKLESGLSPRRVQYIHAVLRHALSYAERWGVTARNVAKLVAPPRIVREEVQPFSIEEARRFLVAVRDDRLSALYRVALGLGLRQGEVLGLTWEDVDLGIGRLTVLRALQRYDGAYHLDPPKTKRSSRTLTLPPALVAAFKEHRLRQMEERLLAGPAWTGNEWGLVFTTEAGAPLNGTVVTHKFQMALHKAGLPGMRFHDLRHWSATFMLVQGVPLRVAMEVLGHSQIGVTANLYSHVLPELEQDATSKVGAVLFAES